MVGEGGLDGDGMIGNACLSLGIGGVLVGGRVAVGLGGVGRQIFCSLLVCIS